MKKTLLLTILVCFTLSGISQLSYEKRIEFKSSDNFTEPDFIPLNKDGLIRFARNNERMGDKYEWLLELYDTDLELLNSATVLLDKNLLQDLQRVKPQSTHFLLSDYKGNFSIVTYDVSSMDISSVEGALPKKGSFYGFEIIDDTALLLAKSKKENILVSIHLKTGEVKHTPIIIEGVSDDDIYLKNIQTLENKNEVYVYLAVTVDDDESDAYVLVLNEKGEKKDVFNLTKNISHTLKDISTYPLAGDTCIYAGSFSTDNSYYPDGLFICKASPTGSEYVEFYNYFDIRHYLSSLPEYMQTHHEEQREKAEAKAEKYRPPYRVSGKKIIPVKDGYLFLAEISATFYETKIYTRENGSEYTKLQFAGYEYTHFVLLKFDLKGKLQWDRSFELSPSIKLNLRKSHVAVVDQTEDSIRLGYGSNNKINVLTFNYSGDLIESIETDEINTNPRENSVERTVSDIDYWFDDTYISYGYQLIKSDVFLKIGEMDMVYFISKIQLE